MRIKKSHLVFKKRRRKLKIFFIFFGSVLFICLIYWFIFLSNFFQIKGIIISNYKEELKASLIEEINQYFIKKNKKFVPLIIYKIFPSAKRNYRNMLLFSGEGLAAFLKNKHPEFREVNSHLSISSQTLKVTINLREIEYLFCQKEEKCYLVDKAGIIFDTAPTITGSLVKKIISLNYSNIKLGTTLFNKNFWQKIEKYYFLTNQTSSPFKIEAIIIDSETPSSITLKTDKGWLLYLNLNESPEYILKIVSQIEKERDLSKIEYLDCRFLPKIYLK